MDPEKFFVRSAIGIDVGKDMCVACSLPEKKIFKFRNESKAIQKFVDDVKRNIRPDQIILEPTSHYERPLARALQEAELRVVGKAGRTDPTQTMRFTSQKSRCAARSARC